MKTRRALLAAVLTLALATGVLTLLAVPSADAAPEILPDGSTSLTLECVECLNQCQAETGYDSTTCRNYYCTVECC